VEPTRHQHEISTTLEGRLAPLLWQESRHANQWREGRIAFTMTDAGNPQVQEAGAAPFLQGQAAL
jgi:hypothetical protein